MSKEINENHSNNGIALNPFLIQNHVNELISREEKINTDFFILKPAYQWMEDSKLKPIPKKLFDCLWYEGEVCILFADTNVGKSILAVQIANIISKAIKDKDFRFEAESQVVLYFDFELTEKQFEARYSNDYTDHYKFNNNFIRIEINPDAVFSDNKPFEECLIEAIEKAIIDTGSKVIIIDNLTYLGNENEKAKNAVPLMKKLKKLKNKYALSLLILAHTPKRDNSKPISKKDLAGSMNLMNLTDSSFTIGECANEVGIRYIKQIKPRQSEVVYGTDNVIVCRLEKQHNFLHFEHLGFSSEKKFLKQKTEKESQQINQEIIALHLSGKSYTEIVNELQVNRSKVQRVLKKYKENN